MKVQAVISLAHEFDRDFNLNEESQKRLNRSCQLLNQVDIPYLITTGWAYHPDSALTLAQAQKDHAIHQHAMPDEKILMEERPKDTVGEAFFTKTGLLDPHGITEFAVVTGDYHLPRAKHFFDFIYGPEYVIHYHGVASAPEYHEKERSNTSIELFDQMMRDVTPGDDQAIAQQLFSKHPMYLSSADSD